MTNSRGWLKHFDFIMLDIIALQACIYLTFRLLGGRGNPYTSLTYSTGWTVQTMSQIIMIIFSNNYTGILRRKAADEVFNVCIFTLKILLGALFFLFIVRRTMNVSRLMIGISSALFVGVDVLVRQVNKLRIIRTGSDGLKGGKRSIALITTAEYMPEALKRLTDKNAYHDYFINQIILSDFMPETEGQSVSGIPIFELSIKTLKQLGYKWIDEVLILLPFESQLPANMFKTLDAMGINVNCAIIGDSGYIPFTGFDKIGPYRVITSGIAPVSTIQLWIKRLMDIVGGILGSAITLVLFIFLAPFIYMKSPGPIFFIQKRIGKNGKIFNMYKFRSMYMDAEERKAALIKETGLEDQMMFKLTDDPRIIGSEKKRKNGKLGGIGNFIRKTSLDEFPQFFNVLKGDMSLVGTRPPTLEEWERYEPHHRARMSIRPGITGMWQVSGRSEITDFEEVVRLDREYIENWSLLLDIKILLKTLYVVLFRRGAK